MASFKVNLQMDQGGSFAKTVTWKPAGVPADLTGCTALAHVRGQINAAVVLHTFSTELGNLILGGTAGTIELVMQDEETAAATWKAGVYDLMILFPDGTKRRLMNGTVTITPGVTRGG